MTVTDEEAATAYTFYKFLPDSDHHHHHHQHHLFAQAEQYKCRQCM